MTHQYITKMNSSKGRTASTCSNYLGHKSNGDYVQYDYFGGTFVGGGDRGIVLDIYNITDNLGGGTWNVHAYEIGTPYKKPVSFSGFYQYKTNNTTRSAFR
jgi:hypothetical protein